jgi:hypothetical protein
MGDELDRAIDRYLETLTTKQENATGGESSGGGPEPLTREDLSRMTTSEINRARKAGELNHLIYASPESTPLPPNGTQWKQEDIKGKSAQQIQAARDRGDLRDLGYAPTNRKAAPAPSGGYAANPTNGRS